MDSVSGAWVIKNASTSNRSYLEAGLVKLGINDARIATSTQTGSIVFKTVLTSAVTGTYTVGALIPVIYGNWNITDGEAIVTGAASTYAAVASSGSFFGPSANAAITNDVLYKVA